MIGVIANAARHEPDAVAALRAGREDRMNRWLRLPLPEPYNPTRVEALRDRLRTPRSAAAPAREKARPNAAKKAAKQPPKKAATKVDKRGKPARAAKVADAGERRRREPVHHVDGRREARGGRPQASRPRALEGHRYG